MEEKEGSKLVKVAISATAEHSRALDGVYNSIVNLNGCGGPLGTDRPRILPIRHEGSIQEDYGAYVSIVDANNISTHNQEWLERRINASAENPYLLLIELAEGMEISEGAKKLSKFLGSRTDFLMPGRIRMHKINPEDSYKSSESRFRQFYEEQIK